MSSMKLYHYWRSSCSWRVRWALTEKQIPFELVAVNLLKGDQFKPEHLKRNPLGFVPALLTQEGELISDSMAILEWLEESYPNKKPLLPSSPVEKARVRQMAYLISSSIQPVQNLSVAKKHSVDPRERKEWMHYWISRGLLALEKIMTINHQAGTYCFGHELTIADMALIPQCYNAERFGVNLQQTPNIHRIYKTCLKLKACQETAPENYQD